MPKGFGVAGAGMSGRFLRRVNSVTKVQTQIISIHAADRSIRRMEAARANIVNLAVLVD
jgi:hypothetical protein